MIKPPSTSSELSQKEQEAQNLLAIEIEKAQGILGETADGESLLFLYEMFFEV